MVRFEARRAWWIGGPPEQVWSALVDLAGHRARWPWLEGLAGDDLRAGSTVAASVRAPAGYRLRFLVTPTRVEPGRRIVARIGGDVRGRAELLVESDGGGAVVRVRWTLWPRRPLLRFLAVAARPVAVDGHDRIIDDAARRFAASQDAVLVPRPDGSGAHDGRGVGAVVRAALVAGVLSGLPSTVHARWQGASVLAAARAAGAVVGRPGLPGGVVAHVVLSLGWSAVLAGALPRRRTAFWGAAAGLGIAAVDLGLVGRRLPAIRHLPLGAQVADHVAFGALVGMTLALEERRVGPHPAPPSSAAARSARDSMK
jgi:uncharacterized protein YndB with AHSA1/START domain